MAKYRTKAKIVEAIQFSDNNLDQIFETFGTTGIVKDEKPGKLWVYVSRTDVAYQPVEKTDWIVKTDSPNIFQIFSDEEFWKNHDRMFSVS
jgi:hypothetical protein